MRLLTYDEHGELAIISVTDSAIPPYAILSHTWGPDTDEVTFADLVTGDGKAKRGYEKIRFCGQQARQDGLQYFWVDTCCIDKTDKAELSHAIRSMFRWYQNATKCYVYLSDVSTRKRKVECISTEFTWEPAFRSSRWFTRGWTLQELLAPSIVEFFSQEREKLGDKKSLKSMIYKITGISLEALDGAPLTQFSVNERLRWKEGRVTRYEEDGAYSLQGILDVELAPVYGEGAPGAFRRLMDEIYKLERCIQDIRHRDPRDDKKRIEETKGGLLADSYRWVLDNTTFQQWQQDQHRLLWVKGDPGKGKTMLLCGIIDKLHSSLPKAALLAYFFCQATDSRINSATAVLRGLLYMLVSQQPPLVSHFRKKHDHAGKALFEDANAWVALTEIFVNILEDPQLSTAYLVIDALDECITDRPKLLDFVAKHSSASASFGVKWIISSRNWPDIEERLEQAGQKARLSLELNAKSVAAAVDIFIRQKVDQLAQEKQYKAETRDAVLRHLTSNAKDTFLWVALVCQDLKLTPKWNVLKKLTLFPPGLHSLYMQMMHQLSESEGAEIYRQVLATVVILYRPVTILELTALVEPLEDYVDDLESVREIIRFCGSFLTIRDDTVYFVHQSAKDFLVTEASVMVFSHGIEAAHYEVFSRSLTILSKTLRRDMYCLQALGTPIENAIPPELDPLAASRYPCVYWIEHLDNSKPNSWASGVNDLQDTGAVDEFIRNKYLYWLEGLSLCRNMTRGVVSMRNLEALVQGRGETAPFTELVHDAYRFIMYHGGAIKDSPLQAYASALLFSPTKSPVRLLFQHEEPRGIAIRPAMMEKWGARLQSLAGHSGNVSSVAFSRDSAWFASASWDQSVKIWDISSSECLQTLKCHDYPLLVAFSDDSMRLVSASKSMVQIWDPSSGKCLQTHTIHSDFGYELVCAFSNDLTKLVCGSRGKTIEVWDVIVGQCLHTLKGHDLRVNSVAFSHDSKLVASGSYDRTIKIWDANSGEYLRTLKGHSSLVTSVSFSQTRLASASFDLEVKIWDVDSGECLQTLNGHSANIDLVAFSHDSARLASASADGTVKIWNASTGKCLQTLEGHAGSSMAFSLDSTRLATAPFDKSVQIWDASSSECLQTLERHVTGVCSVAISQDLNRLVSASYDGTVKIWNVCTGECLQTLLDCNGRCPVSFSHDSNRFASSSREYDIIVCDTNNYKHLLVLEGHTGTVSSAVFSHDSTRLASASTDETVKIWDTSNGVCLKTLEGDSWPVGYVAFSHDSTQLVSVSYNGTVQVWDTSSGACLQTLHCDDAIPSSMTFSYDSSWLASALQNGTIKIWDTSSGACLQTLNIGKILYGLVFSPTESSLCTEMGIITIGSSGRSSVKDVAEPERLRYLGAGISSDDAWITYDGKNMLWVPSEYRQSRVIVRENIVVIGTGSGRVWTCSFNL